MSIFSVFGRFLPMEKVTGALGVTDSNHAQVHAKKAFSVAGIKETIAAGGTFILSLDIPAGSYVHFQAAKITATGHAKVEILDDVTVGTPGTGILPKNRHRLSGGTSLVTCRTDDTISSGTLLDGDIVGAPGAAGKATVGGNTGDDAEWVLDTAITMAIRVTSKEATDAIDVSIRPFWYEEDAA